MSDEWRRTETGNEKWGDIETMTTDIMAKGPFGNTGLQVTPLCVGCSAMSGMVKVFEYDVSEQDALTTLRAAFASPINFFDTASGYGDGESERRIGIVLRELG